jgi:hypothetical protein
LISCDLLALDAEFVAAARSGISKGTGISANNIMIACTHTHSGPATVFLRDCGEVDQPYLAGLRQRLEKLAQQAVAKMREVQVGVGRGQVRTGTLNRRQRGTSIDPDLDVLSFRDSGGQILAVVLNYACHPVCMDHTNRLISADYPGCLSRIVQEQNGAVVLFTNAATGDINPDRMGSYAYAEDLGHALAAETQRILASLEYQQVADLRVAHEMIALPLLTPPTRAELELQIAAHRQGQQEAETAGQGLIAKLHKAFAGWAEATLTQVSRGDAPAYVQAEIQVIHIASACLVGVPGELFSQLGLQIKSSAVQDQVSVLGYTNADIGYIPTRQAYAQGGYEILDAFKFYGYPAALAPEAGDLLCRSAVRLAALACSGSE